MVEKREKDEEKRRKKKSNGADEQDAGYETDGAGSTMAKSRTRLKKKSKSRLTDDGYTTDDGYMSSSNPPLRKTKSKSRFFKLGNRSKSNVEEPEAQAPVEAPPPMPAPAFRLPIAARFATTLNLDTENAVLEPPIGPLGSSRAQTPVSLFSPPLTSTPPIPTFASLPSSFHADTDSVVGAPEPSVISNSTTTSSPTKRTIIRFASDSSDNHGTSSSNGHSFLSRFTASSSGSASTSDSATSPPLKSLNISYPLTRSPSPPSPPLINMQRMIVTAPSPEKLDKRRPSPRPLFLRRIPSDLKKLGGSRPSSSNNSPGSDWSPAGSPFVVLTPTPSDPSSSPSSANGARPGLTSPISGSSANTVTRLDVPSPRPAHSWDVSPVGSFRNVVPSQDFIVPSPSEELFTPPNSLSHYERPPPSPPPVAPLPDVPPIEGDSEQKRVRRGASEFQQRSFSDAPEPSTQPPSPVISPQRGRVSPFPTRPVQLAGGGRGAVPRHAVPSRGFASQARAEKVERYKDLHQPVPPPSSSSRWGWGSKKDSGYASSPETSTASRHGRQGTKVGINVEQPSENEDDISDDDDDDLRDVMRQYTIGSGRGVASEMGHHPGYYEPEAALGRRRSLEVLQIQNYYSSSSSSYDKVRPLGRQQIPPSHTREPSPPPRPSYSPYASEDDLSDDKSRYTSDEKHSLYKMTNNNASQARSLASGWADDSRWSMSNEGGDTQSRSSFMDAEKSDEARERFVRRIEAMFDQNGRELPPNWGIGKNAVVPPVPRIPQGLQGSSSSTWI